MITTALHSNPPSKFLLKADALTKIYTGVGEEITVIRNLNFSINRGEMVAIVGASGAGKSTLLHVLGGLDLPTSGTVMVDNFDIFKNGAVKLDEFRNRRIGFVFQAHHLLPEFSALENVMMPLLIRRENVQVATKLAGDILRRVGLENRVSHRPGELSGGERQRVALARAIVASPALLLADEPTGNLDQKTGAEVFDLIRELHRETHLTSVIVTHNEALAATCDRVLHLTGGNVEE